MRIAVLGAGSAGLATAAHLALQGHEVSLYNRSRDRLTEVMEQGGIAVSGLLQGLVPLCRVSSDFALALQDADVIMVTTSATGHRFIAEGMTPYLKDGQVIVLDPGRTFGALEVRNVVRRERPEVQVCIAETQTFLHTSRTTGSGSVYVYANKKSVGVAACPASDTPSVIARLSGVYPQVVALSNSLESSLNNMGAILHPAPTLLNMTRILSGERFAYYHQGISREVAQVLEEIDRERMSIGQALEVRMLSAKDWLKTTYGCRGDTLFEAIQSNDAYAQVTGPTSLYHRYLYEDIPTGLVPLVSLSDMLGVRTPLMRSVVDLACVILKADFWQTGRTLENVGLAGLDGRALVAYVTTGWSDRPVRLR